jgi:CarD family transcriptional regulator, regulator of rRNA transcription
MTLRLPLMKAKDAGLRALSSRDEVEQALLFLKKEIKATKGIWARRAQEYELKINSGKLSLLAEVIRELYRPRDQLEQSYSERLIYQTALERLVTEIAAVETIAEEQAKDKIENILKVA